jgi:3,4-dihydroxy 2-butanone 4-phosphate synthase / GTP cyclohydrolase II
LFVPVDEAIELIKAGNMLVIADDESPAGPGTLFAAAQLATKETVAVMMGLARGLVRAALPEEQEQGDDAGFTQLGNFPVAKARRGGVLRNAAHAEAAVDLAAIAGLLPAGLICGFADALGEPEPLSVWAGKARAAGLKAVTVEALIAWRRERDTYVTLEAEATLPTAYGEFRMAGFVNRLNGEHHVALVKGTIDPEEPVLVRVHSECLTGDAFHSLKCDCGEQLSTALTAIAAEGRGVLLYLRQEGRGIGLINKIKAYRLQEQGLDTEEANIALGFPADMRDYGIGAQILSALGARKLRLMTNNPKKLVGLRGHGIEIVERVPIIMQANPFDERYFHTKQEKMGHLLNIDVK